MSMQLSATSRVAGITPAVSLAVTLGKSRRVNVIWMVRDPEIIEFYLRQRSVRACDGRSCDCGVAVVT